MKLSFTLLLTTWLSASFLYGQKFNPNYVDGEIYVKLKDTKSVPAANSVLVNIESELPFLQSLKSLYAITARRSFYFSTSPRLQRVYRLKINKPNQLKAFMAALNQQADVEYVEPVPLARRILTPNDPSFTTQYHLTAIQAPQAWAVSTGTHVVKVAIVDDAVQTTHPDLAANCVTGFDVADNDADTNPPNTSFDHGTHVAGIVGAVTNNGVGIASVGFNNVKIMGIKATGDAQNPLYIYYGYEGVEWASLNGAQVINMSWGSGTYSQTEQDVISAVAARGVVMVAAAGNNNASLPFYPASYAGVISVASTNAQDQKSSFSNYGTTVDIAAPGSSIYSTVPFGSYATFSGTSMASPLVASVCGFILSNNNTLTPTQVEQVLKATADNIDAQNPTYIGQLGAGRVNVWKAIACQSNLFSVTLTASGDNLLCTGDSVQLTATPSVSDPSVTYQWRLNNQSIGSTSPTLWANGVGSYTVLADRSGCTVSSSPLTLVANPISTPAPTIANSSAVCGVPLNGANTLRAFAANCPGGGPQTYSYTGSTVGYDAGYTSGSNPTVSVSELGGTITNISVSITWEKKNQADQNACGSAHLGGSPWNDEVSFKLKGPDETVINLVNSGTYGGGYAGVVTTVFQMNGIAIPFRSAPVSGTFLPADPLSLFYGKLPLGLWTLIPDDNGFLDPLCVRAFSITITTNAVAGQPLFRWWDAPVGGNLLSTTSQYTPTVTSIGTHTYYAESQCPNACTSTRVPATFTVRAGPVIEAFPVTFGGTLAQSATPLISQPGTVVSLDTNSLYHLTNQNTNQSLLISGRPPLVSPVTICPGETLLLLAVGCTDGITWAHGALGVGTFVNPTTTSTYRLISCHLPPQCTVSPIKPMMVVNVNEPALTVTTPVPPNGLQTFRAGQLTVENTINPTANVQYFGGQSVLFTPGFQSHSGSVVKAEVKGCN